MSDVKTDFRLAKVVHITSPFEVVINHGQSDFVKPGDRFVIFGEGPQIRDPDSGQDLGTLELVRGQGEVIHVQDHLATIRTLQRNRIHATKRITRELGGLYALADMGRKLVEEELAPEQEAPFVGVCLGDHARLI
jgi:hypothetical protein